MKKTALIPPAELIGDVLLGLFYPDSLKPEGQLLIANPLPRQF